MEYRKMSSYDLARLAYDTFGTPDAVHVKPALAELDRRDRLLAALPGLVLQATGTLRMIDALLPAAQPLHPHDFCSEGLRAALAAYREAEGGA